MEPKSIIITGAAQGLGRAFALQLAGTGVSLGLLDLDAEALENTAQDCRNLGAAVTISKLDICDRKQLKRWAISFDKMHEVDLIISNAGVSPVTAKYGPSENPLMAARIIQVNLIGTINTVNCLMPQMVARKRGQIAMLASIAAYVATGDSPSYCASKAGILAYGRGMRHRLREFDIMVSVVCPGYVETRLTGGFDHAKSLRITADAAATIILANLKRNKAEIAFPWLMHVMARLVYALPEGLRRIWIDKFQYK